MVNQTQTYINQVQSLSGEGNEKELVDTCRRWLTDTEEKTSAADCDRILAALTPSKHSLGYLCGFPFCFNPTRTYNK